MAKYDLTSSLETRFTFTIDGKEFEFRKPTVREMRALAKRFAGIDAETDPDRQVELSDEAMNDLYEFVTPINHDARIADVILDQPMDVQIAFNKIMQKELGADQ